MPSNCNLSTVQMLLANWYYDGQSLFAVVLLQSTKFVCVSTALWLFQHQCYSVWLSMLVLFCQEEQFEVHVVCLWLCSWGLDKHLLTKIWQGFIQRGLPQDFSTVHCVLLPKKGEVGIPPKQSRMKPCILCCIHLAYVTGWLAIFCYLAQY